MFVIGPLIVGVVGISFMLFMCHLINITFFPTIKQRDKKVSKRLIKPHKKLDADRKEKNEIEEEEEKKKDPPLTFSQMQRFAENYQDYHNGKSSW